MNRFFIPIILLFNLFFGATAHGASWPRLADLTIAKYTFNSTFGRYETTYMTSGTVVFPEAPNRKDPGQWMTDKVLPFGLHCNHGNMANGFSVCEWRVDLGHTVKLAGLCKTTTDESWILTDDSTCSVKAGVFASPHWGAAPGGECIVFGKGKAKSTISTPYGDLTASQVANSRDLYCIKPLPPNVVCEIVLPNDGVIDHGIVSPSSSSIRSISAVLNCGKTPKIDLTGGSALHLGIGVDTTLTVHALSSKGFTLTSDLRTTDATPGLHQAATILVVTPE